MSTDSSGVTTSTDRTDDSSDLFVDVRNLQKYFYQNTSLLDKLDPSTSQKKVHAVDGVDLDIQRGEVMGIVGESGCGKSTLARTMLRLIDATDGEVYVDGEDVLEYSESELRQFRRKAQLIYQDPHASLNPRYTVETIIRKPMEIHDIGDSKGDRNQRVRELMNRVELDVDYLENHPHELSGGQKQRVAIARALALNPKLLVADEPTSTLDASVQARILNLLNRLQDEEDLTMMFISHDLSVIRYISDRVSVMYLGEIVEKGPAEDIFQDPKHPYTETLFSSIPVADPTQSSIRIHLEGDVPSPIDPPSGCRFHTRCPKQIPPEDWDQSHERWLELYSVKQSIRDRLEDAENEEGEREDVEADADIILHDFEQDGADLSESTSETLADVRDSLTANDLEEALDLMDAEVVSPCEVNKPEPLDVGTDHEVRCLLYDDQIATDEVEVIKDRTL